MRETTLPTEKGQITIPVSMRKKYGITQHTPLIIEDTGKGIIRIRVMDVIAHDDITFFEDKKEMSLHFKKGINPELLIEAIKEIDG